MAYKVDWGAFFHTVSAHTIYRVSCYGCEHNYYTDRPGVRASPTAQNRPLVCGHSFSFFSSQYAHSSPGAASVDAQLTPQSRGLSDFEQK